MISRVITESSSKALPATARFLSPCNSLGDSEILRSRLGMTGGQSSASVAFGTFTLSNGQGVVLPACPCPDGGGGGGGGPLGTSTTLYLPSSAYATINTVLKAQLKDQFGNPVSFATITFSKDGSSIGTGTTNTTGYASLVWSPGVKGSHVISAAFAGNCCYLASST